jgi:hypothetical protein
MCPANGQQTMRDRKKMNYPGTKQQEYYKCALLTHDGQCVIVRKGITLALNYKNIEMCPANRQRTMRDHKKSNIRNVPSPQTPDNT